MKYQDRAAIRSIEHAACALACLALGDARGAAAHFVASTAWSSLAVYAATAVRLGTPQWMLDAMWIPLPPLCGDVEPEDELLN